MLVIVKKKEKRFWNETYYGWRIQCAASVTVNVGERNSQVKLAN